MKVKGERSNKLYHKDWKRNKGWKSVRWIKETIFGLFFPLFERREERKSIMLITHVTFSINIISLQFEEKLVDLKYFGSKFWSFFQLIRFDFLLLKVTKEDLYQFFVLIAILFLLILGMLVLALNSKNKNHRKRQQELLLISKRIILNILGNVFIIPLLTILKSVFREKENGNFRWLKICLLFLCLIIYVIFLLLESTFNFTVIQKKDLPIKKRTSFFRLHITVYIVIKILFRDSFLFHQKLFFHFMNLFFILIMNLKISYKRVFLCGFKNKLWRVTLRIMLLTNFLFLLSNLFKLDTNSILFTWTLSTLFILLKELLFSDKEFKGFYENNSIDSKIKSLWYLIYLYQNTENDKENIRQLNLFIDFHGINCELKECRLKSDYLVADRQTKQVSSCNEVILNNILEHISLTFITHINEKETNLCFLFSYVSFQIWVKKNKKEVMKGIKLIKLNKTNIQDEFILHCFNNIIKTHKSGNEKEDLSFNNYSNAKINQFKIEKSLIQSIRKCSISTLKLLDLVSYNRPDISLFNKLGKTIVSEKRKVDKTLKDFLSSHQSKFSKGFLLVAKFRKEVFNEDCYFLWNEAERLRTKENKRKLNFDYIKTKEGFLYYEGLSIIISGESNSIGKIINIKAQACRLFGYLREDLIEKNIRCLMHCAFSRNHNSYIRDANKKNLITFFDRERIIFGKSRKGYLIPIHMKIKRIIGEEILYLADIKPVKDKHTVGMWLVDSEGEVIGINSGVISLFSVYATAINEKSKLDDYFPNLFKDKTNFEQKDNKILSDNYLQKFPVNISTKELALNVKTITYNRTENPFYLFCFTNQVKLNFKFPSDPFKVKQIVNNSNFQFSYDRSIKKYVTSFMTGSDSFLQFKKCQSTGSLTESDILENFGEGITTLRLRNGHIINNIVEQETEEDEGKKESVFSSTSEKLKKLNNISKIKETISFKDIEVSRLLRWVLICFFVLFVALNTIVFIDISGKENKFKKYFQYLTLYYTFGNEKFEVQTMGNLVNDLILINEAKVGYINKTTTLNRLTDTLDYKIDKIDRKIFDLVLEIDDAVITDKYFNEDINCYIKKDWFIPMKMYDIIKHFNSKIYAITLMNVDKVNLRSRRVQYTLLNTLNSFWRKLKEFNDHVIWQSEKMTSNDFIFYTCFGGVIVILLSCFLLSFIFETQLRRNIKKSFKQILKSDNEFLFEKTNQIRNFLNSLGKATEKDFHIDGMPKHISIEKSRETDEIILAIKRFSGSEELDKRFFIAFSVFSIFLLSSLLFLQFQFKGKMRQFNNLQREFNVTAALRSDYFMFTSTSYQYAFNKGNEIFVLDKLDDKFIFEIEDFFLEISVSLNNFILSNYNYRQKSHNDFLLELSNKNFCQFLKERDFEDQGYKEFSLDSDICFDIFYKVDSRHTNPSLFTFMNKYSKNINTFISDIYDYKQSNFTESIDAFGSSCDINTNFYCVFHHPLIQKNYNFKNRFLKDIFSYVAGTLLSFINSDVQDMIQKELITSIILVVCLVIVFICFVFLYFLRRIKETKELNTLFKIFKEEQIN